MSKVSVDKKGADIPKKPKNIAPVKNAKTKKVVKEVKILKDVKPKSSKNAKTIKTKKQSKKIIVQDDEDRDILESSEETPENRDIEQMIRFVIQEVHHLRYKDRVDILCIIKEQVGTDVIYESSDGSRVQMKKLGDEIIKQIYTLVVGRLKEVDIISDS